MSSGGELLLTLGSDSYVGRDLFSGGTVSKLYRFPMTIEPHLLSTVELLARALGANPTVDELRAAAVILSPHMSDRNLGAVLAHVAGLDPGWGYNEALRAASAALPPTSPEVLAVRSLLAGAGLEEWSREE